MLDDKLIVVDEVKELKDYVLLNVNKMYYPEIGGVEVTAQRIAELGLETFGKSIVITFSRHNVLGEENLNGVHVIRLNSVIRHDPIRLSPRFGSTLKKYAQENTVAVFHFPSVQSELFFYNNDIKAKKICFYHSDIVGWGGLGNVYNRLIVPKFLSKMDLIVVTSANYRDTSPFLRSFLGKVRVIPSFVDTKHFRPTQETKRQKICSLLDCSIDSRIVMYIGRFGRYKGLDYLVKAIALLPDNYFLVLIGDGPERMKIESLVTDLKLENRVLRLDHVKYDDLPEYYSAADVFVLPSIDRGEAFGLVVVESMACGVPVVTTELGTGTSFHNIDGVTGRVVPPRDEKALANAIAEICEHEYKYDPQVIRKRAEEFSAERFDQHIKEVFEKVVSEGSTAKS